MEKNLNGSAMDMSLSDKTRGTFMKPLLECETCGRVLSSAYKLREHVMIHTGQKPHACTKCSQAFRTKPDLARHMRIHTGVRPYACKLCGQRFYRSDNLKGHMKTHKDMEVLSCFRCGKGYKTLEQLNVHYKATHEKEDKAENQAHLEAIQKSEEFKYSTGISQDGMGQDEEMEVDFDSPVETSKASPATKRQPSPTKMLVLRTEEKKVPTEVTKSTPHTFWCSECGQGFHQKGALALHVKVAHNSNAKKTLSEMAPEIMVEKISSDTAYICPTCGQVFTELYLLKGHLKNVHQNNGDAQELIADENMNTCQPDDMEFDLKTGQTESVITIDSDDSQREMDTDQSIPTSNDETSLFVTSRDHSRISGLGLDDGEDDMELITCDTCKKVFPTKQDLYRHEVSEHTGDMPFKCTSCGRSFARKDRLVNHMRLHTGRSPHHCEFCGKTFTAASSLKEHLKIHSGMKPHRCLICLKDFRQKCVLTRHMKNVHKNSPLSPAETNNNTLESSPQTKGGVEKNDVSTAQSEPPFILTTDGKHLTLNHSKQNESSIKDSLVSPPVNVSNAKPCTILPKPGVSLLTGLTVQNIRLAQDASKSVVIVPIANTNTTALLSSPVAQEKSPSSIKVKCPLCVVICGSDNGLAQHIRKCHPGYKLLNNMEQPAANQKSNIKAFRCVSCNVNFATKPLLLEHCNLVHPSNSTSGKIYLPISAPVNSIQVLQTAPRATPLLTHECLSCDMQFPSKERLAEHRHRVHPPLGEKTSTLSPTTTKSMENIERQQSSSSNDSLASPGYHESGSDSETSPLGMSLRTIPQPDGLYADGHKYRCALCSEGFESTEVLSDHMDQHLRSNPFFCNFCGQTFKNTTTLEDHIETHQQTRDPLFHVLAAAGSPSQTPLSENPPNGDSERTAENIYSEDDKRDDDGLYGCNFCFQAFSKVKRLVLHLKSHITDKPHVCILCGKAFSQSSYLKQHVMTHTGQRPHICHICGRGFVQKTQLVLHVRKHTGFTPFRCVHCNKSFTNKSVLKLHLQKHLPERPYSCSVCGRGFSQAGNMRRHAMMVHRDHNLDQVGAIMSDTYTYLPKVTNDFTPDSSPVKTLEGEFLEEVQEEEGSSDLMVVAENPLDLSVRASESGIIILDEPADDLMVMGAYYSSQLTQEEKMDINTLSGRVGDESVEARSSNDESDSVFIESNSDWCDITQIESVCNMTDLVQCSECVHGFSNRKVMKEHLLEKHLDSVC